MGTPNADVPRGTWIDYTPSEDEIRDLISRASQHDLGQRYLVEGALDSVAATFRVHAFTVDAARRQLSDTGE